MIRPKVRRTSGYSVGGVQGYLDLGLGGTSSNTETRRHTNGRFYSRRPCNISSHFSTFQVALGGLDRGLVIVGRGGGGYEYFPSGYVLLDCGLTGLVSCSHILCTLVRLRVTT